MCSGDPTDFEILLLTITHRLPEFDKITSGNSMQVNQLSLDLRQKMLILVEI